ncbi:MAG: hypothetical protein HPY78_03440 [Brevinematales bacterium]|nr:hypothetical protein [Brevinematales bacterium]
MKIQNGSWIPVFKAGTHIDSSGVERTFSEKDLDTIIERYKSNAHEAPICIGHPKTNAPAFGWVADLKRIGSTLFAQVRDISPEFAEWVEKGLYKKRSISLYPDMTLRHVGFLGAMPPAIKGLPDVSFAETEVTTIEFQDIDTKFEILADILRNLREWFIEQFGTEVADSLINNYDISTIESETSLPENEFSEGSHTKEIVNNLLKELDEQKKRLKEYEAEKEAQKQKEKLLRIQHYAETLVSEGKLLPKDKEDFVRFATTLDDTTPLEFAEGQKTTALERFVQFFSTRHVDFEEKYNKKPKKTLLVEDRDDLASQVKEYAKEHNMSFHEALKVFLQK